MLSATFSIECRWFKMVYCCPQWNCTVFICSKWSKANLRWILDASKSSIPAFVWKSQTKCWTMNITFNVKVWQILLERLAQKCSFENSQCLKIDCINFCINWHLIFIKFHQVCNSSCGHKLWTLLQNWCRVMETWGTGKCTMHCNDWMHKIWSSLQQLIRKWMQSAAINAEIVAGWCRSQCRQFSNILNSQYCIFMLGVLANKKKALKM